MNKVFTNKEEFEQYILDNLEKQYGIEFETTTYLNDNVPLFYFKSNYSGFTGNVKPKCCTTEQEKLLHGYYTVCNSARTFDTQAHVYMFENQLRTDVEKILSENDIKYDIIQFRGMDRDINKWSSRSSYSYYKTSMDYETWIYIKVNERKTKNEYAKEILPVLKKIYLILEPDYNPTVVFYTDKYVVEFYDEFNKTDYREEYKNIDLVFLDLGKFKNISEWTEKDIEQEIAHIDENLFITKWKKANGLE